MNNPTILKGVSILAFGISALFTIMLMISGCVGIIATVLTIGMAIVLELSKCGFAYESLSNTKLLLPIRVVLGIIALLLVGSSIFASASYVQNNAIKANATQMKDTSQYKQLEAGKALQQDLYNVKKKEIEDLKTLQGKQQVNGDNIVNSMPKNYIDRKNQAKQDTASQIAKTQDIINSKSTELSQIGASLQVPIDTTNLKLSSSNGYSAMFRSLAEWINSSEDYKSNPVKAESLEMWFFIGLGVIFEFVAVLTAYLSQLKGISTLPIPQREIQTAPTPKTETIITTTTDAIGKDASFQHSYKPRLDGKPTATTIPVDTVTCLTGESMAKPKIQIGFQHSTASTGADEGFKKKYDKEKTIEPLSQTKLEGFSKSDLLQYIDFMYQNQKPNSESPGFKKIFENVGTGSKLEDFRKIRGHLERLDVISTDGLKTKILCTKEECLKKI